MILCTLVEAKLHLSRILSFYGRHMLTKQEEENSISQMLAQLLHKKTIPHASVAMMVLRIKPIPLIHRSRV